jgi:hypothetical protein
VSYPSNLRKRASFPTFSSAMNLGPASSISFSLKTV